MIDNGSEQGKEQQETALARADLEDLIQARALTKGVDSKRRPIRLSSYTTPQTIRVMSEVITDEERQRPQRVREEILYLIDAGGLGIIYPDDPQHRWFSRKNPKLFPHITIDAVVREDEPTMGIRIGLAEGTYSTEAILTVEKEGIFVQANKLGTEDEPQIIPKRPAIEGEIATFFKVLTHPDLDSRR